jgi:osmoprotectant transport system permease protein
VSNALLADIARMTVQHVVIVVIAVALAALVGIPLGVYASRRSVGGRLLLRTIDAIQTIPSLALFGLLIPLPLLGGIGTRTAIIALILYSLLPIVRNTVTGLQRIDPLLIETGLALGMRKRELFREVELPLAMPTIVGGIRLALIIGIGVATIAAAVGGGGLGTLIFRGVAMVDTKLMLAGALPAAALALVVDLLLSRVERAMARRRGEG